MLVSDHVPAPVKPITVTLRPITAWAATAGLEVCVARQMQIKPVGSAAECYRGTWRAGSRSGPRPSPWGKTGVSGVHSHAFANEQLQFLQL
jgi:hypothetical protein